MLELSFSLFVPFVLVGMILESQQLVLRRDLFHLVDKFFNIASRERKQSHKNLIPSDSSYLFNETTFTGSRFIYLFIFIYWYFLDGENAVIRETFLTREGKKVGKHWHKEDLTKLRKLDVALDPV